MVMPQYLQDVCGSLNSVSTVISQALTPVIGLIFAISALIIVVSCVYNVVEHLLHIRRRRDVLAAINLGADLVIASVLLELITATGSANVLYVVATAAIAISIRMGAAKLSK